METSTIIVLVVSASISFALGRTIMHFRNKKKQARKDQALALQAKALRDAPPGPESKNKSKRKRQARLARR
ncbi:MAG: hypothetical protein EAZ34_00340 [Polaromonas sp.]|nr:MAG: hypothetical protein EAZ34_00340 [Polaromonas sp.]